MKSKVTSRMRSKNSLTITISLLAFLALVFQASLDNSQNWRLSWNISSRNIIESERSTVASSDPGEFEINTSGGGVQTEKPRPEKNSPYLVATIASGAGMIGGSVRLSSGSEFSFGSPKEIVSRDIQKAQIIAARKSLEFTLLGLKPSGVS